MFAVQNLPLSGTKSAQVHVPQYPLSFTGRSNTTKGHVNTAKTKSKHIRCEKSENRQDGKETVTAAGNRGQWRNCQNDTTTKKLLRQKTDDTVMTLSTRYNDDETTAAGNR